MEDSDLTLGFFFVAPLEDEPLDLRLITLLLGISMLSSEGVRTLPIPNSGGGIDEFFLIVSVSLLFFVASGGCSEWDRCMIAF